MFTMSSKGSTISRQCQGSVFLMGFHFDGLDIGEHVQPKEGHDADEANSQPGRYKHEVHKLHRKPEDAIEKKSGDAFLLKLKPSLGALLSFKPSHAHVEDDDHPGGEDELVKEQFLGNNST